MPIVDAVIFTTWRLAAGSNVPDAIAVIGAWVKANNERMSNGALAICVDETGLPVPTILPGNVFAARLQVSLATAQQFASDPRFWKLGWRVFGDDGELQSSNWDQPLDAASRTQALDWLENHGYNRAAVANRFGTGNSRREILDMLRVMFRE